MSAADLSFEEFEEKYDTSSEEEELTFDNITEVFEHFKGTDIDREDVYRYVWTSVSNDDPDPEKSVRYINGFYIVDKLKYIVCETPWGTEDQEANKSIDIFVSK